MTLMILIIILFNSDIFIWLKIKKKFVRIWESNMNYFKKGKIYGQ